MSQQPTITGSVLKRAASRSDAQQRAEQTMITEFTNEIGKPLAPKILTIDKAQVSLDGYHEDDRGVTLVEVWAHLGAAKGAQPHKVRSDMLKLAFVAAHLKRSCPDLKVDAYLIFADHLAAKVIEGKSWAARAADAFGIKTRFVPLPEDEVEALSKAQKKQDIRFDECDDSTPSA
jgi:hypothetical protein